MQKLTLKLRDNQLNFRRVILLFVLYSIPPAVAMLPITDPDIWWRLRTGQWIIEHKSAPVVDVFSTFSMGKPWIEYSWLFEVLVYAIHAHGNLTGLVYFVVTMAFVITFAAHKLVRQTSVPFAAEIALVVVGMMGMNYLMTPRPWLFTILFFIVELLVIDRARRSGKDRWLWALPLVFALWANLHIQFVYGLAAVGLLLVESILVVTFAGFGYTIDAPAFSPKRLALVFVSCAGAALLTPYHYLLYRQIYEYLGQTVAFATVTELLPMSFRSPENWIVLGLTIMAASVLGRRLKWEPFPILLFLMSAFLAFRARRDAWILVLVAIWIIGEAGCRLFGGQALKFNNRQILITAVMVAIVTYCFTMARQITERDLQSVVEKKYPVNAVKYIEANRLPGPLFNDFDWGGFLIWALRERPVSMDGRTNLFGNERLRQAINTWQGRPGWDSDSDLLKAKLIISNTNYAFTSLLRLHPNYKLAYEDNVAAVFIRGE
jgi:hypothetical protein